MKKRAAFLLSAVILLFFISTAVLPGRAQTQPARRLEAKAPPVASNITVVDLRKASPARVVSKAGTIQTSLLSEQPTFLKNGSVIASLTKAQLNIALKSVQMNSESSSLYAHLTPDRPYITNKACLLLHFPWAVYPHYISFYHGYNGYLAVEVQDKGTYIVDILLEFAEHDPQASYTCEIFKWGDLYKTVSFQGVSGPQHLLIIADQDSDIQDFPREAFGKEDWLHVYCFLGKIFASWHVYQVDVTKLGAN